MLNNEECRYRVQDTFAGASPHDVLPCLLCDNWQIGVHAYKRQRRPLCTGEPDTTSKQTEELWNYALLYPPATDVAASAA